MNFFLILKIVISSRIGRHYLQLQASIEVLRMLEISEVFHSFAPTDYVELFTAATVGLFVGMRLDGFWKVF